MKSGVNNTNLHNTFPKENSKIINSDFLIAVMVFFYFNNLLCSVRLLVQKPFKDTIYL